MSDDPSHREPGSIATGVRQMLTELALPAGALRHEHGQLEKQFVAALDPLLVLLCGAKTTANGELDFAVRQLTARAMSDTIASLHLITHGYLNQAYGTMRTAYEGLDLVRLLARDAEEARLWVNTKQGHRDFSPGAVRKRLNEDSFDPIYGQLSELSHPRFAASKLGAFGVREQEQPLRLVVRVGPFILDEAADQWLAASFVGLLIAKIGAGMSQLVEAGAVTESDWERSVLASHHAIVEMGTLIGGKLREFGLPAEGLLQQFAQGREVFADVDGQ